MVGHETVKPNAPTYAEVPNEGPQPIFVRASAGYVEFDIGHKRDGAQESVDALTGDEMSHENDPRPHPRVDRHLLDAVQPHPYWRDMSRCSVRLEAKPFGARVPRGRGEFDP